MDGKSPYTPGRPIVYIYPKPGFDTKKATNDKGEEVQLAANMWIEMANALISDTAGALKKFGVIPGALFSASTRSTPSDLTAERGTATTAAMRHSDVGSIDLRESFGQKFDLNLPLHVRVGGGYQLKGNFEYSWIGVL